MKTSVILLSFVIFVVATSLVLQSVPATDAESDQPLSEFMIGRWRPIDKSSNGYLYEFNILDTGFVVIDVENYANIVMRYQSVSDQRIQIIGRVGAEWDLARDGQSLVVRADGWPFSGTVIFQRMMSVPWWIIASLLAISILTALVIPMSRFRPDNTGQHLDEVESFVVPKSLPWIARRLAYLIFQMGLLAAGSLVGYFAWGWGASPAIYLILLPWDGVIMLESSMTAAILGSKMFMGSRSRSGRKMIGQASKHKYLADSRRNIPVGASQRIYQPDRLLIHGTLS